MGLHGGLHRSDLKKHKCTLMSSFKSPCRISASSSSSVSDVQERADLRRIGQVQAGEQTTRSSSSSSLEHPPAKVSTGRESRTIFVKTKDFQNGQVTLVSLLQKELDSGTIDLTQDCLIRVRRNLF